MALAPEMVNVFAATVTAIDEVVEAVNVNALFVVALEPVYCKVPPPNTKLAAAPDAWPRLPATPPFPIVATLSVPAFIVVAPV